jgi:hypothetical protein
MGATRYLVGRYANHLTRLPAGNIAVSSAHPEHPKDGLFDGRAIRPWRAVGAGTTYEYVTVDLNLNDNTGLEMWVGGVPAGWSKATSGTGTVAETTVPGQAVSGSAARLGGGTSGVAILYRVFTAVSGEYMTLFGSMRGDGSVPARCRVYNTKTKNYLQPGGASWARTPSDLFTESGASHVAKTVDFRVEPFSTTQSDTTLIRVELIVTGNGFGYFDNWTWFPHVDFCGVFGHNLPADLTANYNLNRSSDGYVAHEAHVADMHAHQPSFYTVLPTRLSSRWVRFLAFGGAGEGGFVHAPGIGELVIGQTRTFNRGPDHASRVPHELSADRAQARAETAAGDEYVFSRSSRERRTLRLPYSGSDAFMANFLDEIHHRSENGEHPLVVVRDESLPDVILGRVEGSYSVKRTNTSQVSPSLSRNRTDLIVRELAFPQFAK